MAQKVHIVLVDDIDGSEAEETVTFGIDGVSYEIDLNADNAAKLRDAVAPYVGHARRVGGRKAAGRKAAAGGPSAGDIREWARENGYELSDRGRVPAEVRQAYDAAH
ncbi:Lsr2 family protein [Nocardioides dubius]|uniref:Lsr2 family protein n=1 Tax=Nocardioides dubius TaxID=317019 RepID=A0ABP4ECD4_9ACTN